MDISCYTILEEAEEIDKGDIYKGILSLDNVKFRYEMVFKHRDLKDHSKEEILKNIEFCLYDKEEKKRYEKKSIDDKLSRALTDPIMYSIDQYLKGIKGRCNYPFTEDRNIGEIVKNMIK
ncbi:hypothetical protein GF336_06400 [Candidatus Woesearchaeota archaeon]|nr:hypothetical protein [Candidatus Woesearchaeota archaeon]